MPWESWGGFARDTLFAAGGGLVVAGVSLIYDPAAVILSGLALIAVSWFGFPRGA